MDNEELRTHGRMLAIKDVAKMWGVSERFISKLAHEKNEADRLPSYKVGRRVLYNVDELAWYLEKHKNDVGEFPEEGTE